MSKKVLVTGYGIISGIGCGEEETLVSLLAKRSAIDKICYLETALSSYPAAEVKKSNAELVQIAQLDPSKTYSRSFLFGIIAAKQAVGMASCEKNISAVVGATTVGGMDLNEKYYKKLIAEEEECIGIIQSFETADATERIAIHFGVKSNITTASTACSSSANAIMFGARLIKNGIADCVLVGGMDALSRFSLNGFNSIEILSPTGCRPFDKNRNGVTIGEGAAFLVLESEKHAAGKKVYGEITGYANRNEAFHQTSSSPDGKGAFMTISDALRTADLQADDIDYINAHGTGTEVNDISEANAIQAVFNDNIPPVSSTKGYTGHTLAAAGAIEAVISLMAIKNQTVFPNLRLESPIEDISFTPETEVRKHEINHVLSNSFGFGGANSTLIISKSSHL